jgi:hypothetical protein
MEDTDIETPAGPAIAPGNRKIAAIVGPDHASTCIQIRERGSEQFLLSATQDKISAAIAAVDGLYRVTQLAVLERLGCH